MKSSILKLDWIVLILSILLLTGCGSQPQEQASDVDEEESMESEVMEATAAPQGILVVMHQVEDFATWKAAFDQHKSFREEAGLTDLGVMQQEADPNTVAVAAQYSDIDQAKEFANSADLKKAMEEAGVTGPPEVTFIQPEVDIEGDSPSDQYLSVIHEVSNYETWKAAFDADQEARQQSGLVLRDLSRNTDNANEVWLLFAVTDRSKSDAFINSPELAQVMEQAGVVGEPRIIYWNRSVDVAQ